MDVLRLGGPKAIPRAPVHVRSSWSPEKGGEFPIPDLLGYFVYPPFNPSLPLGKKMGYAKPR